MNSDVEGVLEHRIRPVAQLGGLGHHVQEVAGVGQFVVRVGVGQADRMPVGERRERRHLGDQPHDLLAARFRVEDRLRVRVERRQRGHGADQDAHRVRVVMEAVDELLDVLVHERVVGDLLDPRLRLGRARQLAVQQQVGDLQERAVLGQFLDRVAAVAQDPLLTVDEGDGAAAAGGVQERRIVGQQPEVVVADLDLAQVGGADRTVGDRNLVAPAGPGVGDLKHALAWFCHRGSALFLGRRL